MAKLNVINVKRSVALVMASSVIDVIAGYVIVVRLLEVFVRVAVNLESASSASSAGSAGFTGRPAKSVNLRKFLGCLLVAFFIFKQPILYVVKGLEL